MSETSVVRQKRYGWDIPKTVPTFRKTDTICERFTSKEIRKVPHGKPGPVYSADSVEPVYDVKAMIMKRYRTCLRCLYAKQQTLTIG